MNPAYSQGASARKQRLRDQRSTSYAELEEFKSNSRLCKICCKKHPISKLCQSKPPYPPNAYYARCDICFGYHPRGRCYFEYMRQTLYTPSSCKNCHGLTHIGFCNDAILCSRCETKHNAIDGCVRTRVEDLSNNLCPHCNGYHNLHCPADLFRIQTNLEFWCNRCKIQHEFMRCIPHCVKCYRRHDDNFPCPWPNAPNTVQEQPQQQQQQPNSLQRKVQEERLTHQTRKRTTTHRADTDSDDERENLARALVSLNDQQSGESDESRSASEALEVHLNDEEIHAIVNHLESNPSQEPLIFNLISKIKQ